ncbi:limbic system-associated membrane protein isoform X5 [Aplysia californica]|nr:limbic system-associated membrane protein isoform X5 [Aplysia californica]XP_005092373.1 limbic system-associated membrane protein isoform X5 [Aplysia californica]XP_035824080.1 limbic system-associated membrane protein isoform X5 [Aplysia californica]
MSPWIKSYLLLFLSPLYTVLTSLEYEPKFDRPMVNVTVKEKNTAILPCSVNFLGSHEVVWTDQFSTLLTYQDRRIIDDERLSVERPYTRDWNLHIRDVRYSDQGIYNCQINTTPVKIKTINLVVLGRHTSTTTMAPTEATHSQDVFIVTKSTSPQKVESATQDALAKVPAKILEHLSSTDTTVREGDTVTLICNVTGTPHPEVTWYRKHGRGEEKQSELCPGNDKVGVNGEVLIIHNVTRYCGGDYECVAFNGVPPAVSKIVEVFVEFAPEIYLPNKKMRQEKGKDTILECTVTAFPHAVTLWQKDGVQITTSTLKYRVEVYDEDANQLTLSLRVFNIEESDFGAYTCVSSNTLGEDQETMYLSEHVRATVTTKKPSTSTQNLYIPATSHQKLIVSRRPPVARPSATLASGQSLEGLPMENTHDRQPTRRPVYEPSYRGRDDTNKRILATKKKENASTRPGSVSFTSQTLASILLAVLLSVML